MNERCVRLAIGAVCVLCSICLVANTLSTVHGQVRQGSAEAEACKEEQAKINSEIVRVNEWMAKHHANRPRSENDQTAVHSWNQEEIALRNAAAHLQARINAFNKKCH
jgi:hypothetical protein